MQSRTMRRVASSGLATAIRWRHGTFKSCLYSNISRLSFHKQQHRHPFTSFTRTKNTHQHHRNEYYWVASLLGRFASAFGLVHVVSEYGVELTLCEGPSMMPTIQPQGEIILVDRFTPRFYGLQDGCDGKQRAETAKTLQKQHESQRKDDTWYQPMIPANEMPKRGGWKRMFQKCTSGIHVGDVVVVQHPNRVGTVCKRVLGLPGDVVVEPPRDLLRKFNQRGLFVIPDGHVWIEGDNSMNSSDSRNYGPISAALIVGRVLCRVWPLRGHAMMERGARPEPSANEPFSGSTILPAGYEGEAIVRHTKEI